MVADSVGKIQLDIEINPNSLAREIGSVGRAFSDGMKNSFSQVRNFAKSTFGDMGKQVKSAMGGGSPVSDDAAMAIQSLSDQMDNASNQAEHFRQKLKDLQNSYDQLTAREQQGTFGQKLREEILRTEERMLRYGERSDKLRLEIEKLEQSTSQLERSTGRAGRTTERASRGFARAGDSARRAQGPIAGFATSMNRVFARVLRQIFVFAVLYKAIRGMIDYTGAALATNQEFVNSLNQVKTNLQVAFMPIYQAILPALNALMRALATVTTYIASFISALFGKTYKQSFQAAQGLNAAKEAIGGYGKAAKKAAKDAQAALMSFDEIHTLSKDTGADDAGGGGGPGLVAPPVDVSPIDAEMQGLVGRIKSVLATLFEPIKAAWANEGVATVASMKHALGGIWALVKEIGKSFAVVWTGGTGQAILETFLRILQQIFGLVGDIGYTFASVWAEGGRGTAIVQGIANIFLHLLELIERVGESLRYVWGEVGEDVARTFLDIIGATVDVLENLAEKLIWVWDNGGRHLFEGLVMLGAKVFELAGLIYTDFVAPFVNWFVDMMAPALATVFDWAGWLLDKFVELIDWLMGDGYPVLDIIVTVLGSMAIAFGVVQLAIAIYNGVIAIATALSAAFGAVMAFITSPIGLVVLAIGALIAVGILLYKNWDQISAWIKGLWEGLRDTAIRTFNKIKDTITGTFNTVKTTVINIWDTITSKVTGAFNAIYSKAKSVFGSMKTFISGICDSISGFFKSMVNGVIKALNGMTRGLNKLKFDVPDWVPGLGGKKFGFNIPQIPQLAKGAVVEQPTLAMIGEKRKKEAVLPLEQNTGWMDTLAGKIAAIMGGGGGDDGPLIIQVMIGGNKILEEVIDAAKRKNAKAGRTVVQLGVT